MTMGERERFPKSMIVKLLRENIRILTPVEESLALTNLRMFYLSFPYFHDSYGIMGIT